MSMPEHCPTLLEGLKKKEYTMILISALPPIKLPYKPVKFTNTISLFNGYFINLGFDQTGGLAGGSPNIGLGMNRL
jgi:hypothetical protein